MPEQESNRAVVERFIRAVEARDGATQFALLHPDVEIHEPEGLPYGGRWHGHDGWRALNRAIMATWAELDLIIHCVFGEADSDVLIVHSSLSGLARDTGRSYGTEVLEQWFVVDGLVIRIRPFYWDTRQAAEAAGALEGVHVV